MVAVNTPGSRLVDNDGGTVSRVGAPQYPFGYYPCGPPQMSVTSCKPAASPSP